MCFIEGRSRFLDCAPTDFVLIGREHRRRGEAL
jgi:hypothetical protein